jgi:phosphotransferase system enzyme I (PtsI)
MKIYRGTSASSGIAIGFVVKHEKYEILDKIPNSCIADSPDTEVKKLRSSLERFERHLEILMGSQESLFRELFEAYRIMARAIIEEAAALVISERICSELAVKRVFTSYSEALLRSENELIEMRELDLRNVVYEILKRIKEDSQDETLSAEQRFIAVADYILPTDLISLIRVGLKGLVTRKGGVTSHIAVIARNNEIPYIIVPMLDLESIKTNSRAIVDAINGQLILEPVESLVKKYMEILKNYEDLKVLTKPYARSNAVTFDGKKIDVLCNIGNVEEARLASSLGCDGVGLYRVEFLYTLEKPPNEERLLNALIRSAEFFKGKEIVIRAPDLGGDKPVPYLRLKEPNPFLGLRGIRLLLEYNKEILMPFLRAFVRAAERFGENLKLMIPMVSRVKEIYEIYSSLEMAIIETSSKLRADDISLGIMVETPAAALMLDLLVDTGLISFVSFGTNDLAQYVLAVDRTNEKLGELYNDLDPSVIRIMSIAIEKIKNKRVKLGVCGEIASRQISIPILIGLGIESLSVNPPAVGLIKYTISKLSHSKSLDLVKEITRSAISSEDVIRMASKLLISSGIKILR